MPAMLLTPVLSWPNYFPFYGPFPFCGMGRKTQRLSEGPSHSDLCQLWD